MPIYWGDIHNHCGISYGYGSLENALANAQKQLHFCAVTGHAMWPDMPRDRENFGFVIDFHEKGFAKLAAQWDKVQETVEKANRPGDFVTFHSYEMHSSEFGDHHVLSPKPCPILNEKGPAELYEKLQPYGAMLIPHHVAYRQGYRGINWSAYDPARGPVVEVFSKHGCGMMDRAPYNYLHTMGPRDSRSTVVHGLNSGKRFGFTGSTDHHAGFPGSYGDGRVAVMADRLTRTAIIKALRARRCYCCTGDKIALDFRVGDAPFGRETDLKGPRPIRFSLRGADAFERVVVYKNGVPWRWFSALDLARAVEPKRYKVRFELGWGRSEESYAWNVGVRIKNGRLLGVEPCFRGRSILAPKPGDPDLSDVNKLDNAIETKTADAIAWRCESFANLSTQHSATSAMILEIEGDDATELACEVNAQQFTHALGDLKQGGFVHYEQPFASEAIVVHRAVPESEYVVSAEVTDDTDLSPGDFYFLEAIQFNGQAAWASPVWITE